MIVLQLQTWKLRQKDIPDRVALEVMRCLALPADQYQVGDRTVSYRPLRIEHEFDSDMRKYDITLIPTNGE